MRRMKEMSQSGGGGTFGMNNFPEMYNLVVNTNLYLASKILSEKEENKRQNIINQVLDLAKFSQGLLQGEKLTKFVKRGFTLIK